MCVFGRAYYRLYFTITLCNFYLSQEGNAADQEIRNAEVRFIRAYNYALVMDLYGNAALRKQSQLNWLKDIQETSSLNM